MIIKVCVDSHTNKPIKLMLGAGKKMANLEFAVRRKDSRVYVKDVYLGMVLWTKTESKRKDILTTMLNF